MYIIYTIHRMQLLHIFMNSIKKKHNKVVPVVIIHIHSSEI